MSKLDPENFKANHISANRQDFVGNGSIGRYVFIPGSNSRARYIAEKHFKNVEIKSNSRGHDLYLGDMEYQGKIIKVAAISTGMGTPSVDLILTELILLGAKRFLRVGTAGGVQDYTNIGDVVFATAAVRDESTSNNYIPPSFPAVADLNMTIEANLLAKESPYKVHLGIVHTKDSLYARQFLFGPSENESITLNRQMQAYGILATEMECAHIYVLAKLYSQELNIDIKAGCVLGIIAKAAVPFAGDKDLSNLAIENAIDYGTKLFCTLAVKELFTK